MGWFSTGCKGSVAEIIAQIQRPTPSERKAEVTMQPGQPLQFGHKGPSEKARARRRSRESRPHICRSSLSIAILSVDRNRTTCSPGQENTRGTAERDQVARVSYLFFLAVLDRYQDSQNQEALPRPVSLRSHARQSRTQLSFCRRYKRDPAARRNECFLSRILKLCRWSVETLPRRDFAASFPGRPCTQKRHLAMPV